MSTEAIFLEYSAAKLAQMAGRISDCLSRLSPEQVWARGAESENAIGNLVLHLCGNVRQWIGAGVAGRPDVRTRDAEFAARGEIAPAELLQRLATTVAEATEIVRSLPSARLSERTNIQGYDVSVLEAIYHVVEHFSGHTGQIIFATKLFTGADLDFYKHIHRQAHTERVP